MTVSISVLGVPYTVPSSAADTNWAAQQVAFEQALAAGVNGGAAGTSQNVSVTSAADVLPSDTNVIVVSCSSGITLTSTPSIVAGSSVGQRLQIIMSQTTSGSLGLTTGGGTTLSLKTASLSLSTAGFAVELLWSGALWVEVSRSEAPGTVPQDFSGFRINRGQAFGEGTTVLTDPVAAVTIAVDITSNTFDVNLTSADVTMIATPTLTSGDINQYDGQELTIINRGTTYNLLLKDDGTVAGTKLRMSAATTTLIGGSSVRLRYSADDGNWYEVAKAILV